jgi:hypothetical protein
LSAQHVAAQLPALPAAGQVGVVLETAQQKARLVGRQVAVHQGGQLLEIMIV